MHHQPAADTESFEPQSQEPGGALAVASAWPPNLPAGPAAYPDASLDQDMLVLSAWASGITMQEHSVPLATASDDMIYARVRDGSWKCMLDSCFRCFDRHQELVRHQNSNHFRSCWYHCRSPGCPRARSGFTRKDNRDTHERRAHGRRLE